MWCSVTICIIFPLIACFCSVHSDQYTVTLATQHHRVLILCHQDSASQSVYISFGESEHTANITSTWPAGLWQHPGASPSGCPSTMVSRQALHRCLQTNIQGSLCPRCPPLPMDITLNSCATHHTPRSSLGCTQWNSCACVCINVAATVFLVWLWGCWPRLTMSLHCWTGGSTCGWEAGGVPVQVECRYRWVNYGIKNSETCMKVMLLWLIIGVLME